MSTRAQINFEGSGVWIYSHYDGYPSGIQPLLRNFINMFTSYRGYFDEDYMTAQYIYELIKETHDRNPGRHYLGFGVGTEKHGNIDYFYLVKKDCSIKIKSREQMENINV